jgi:predicted permease
MALVALARVLRRVRAVMRRRSFERDIDDELRSHMELVEARHLALGHTPAEARALTHKEFGSMVLHKDEIRDAHGLTFADDLRRDIRFAFRTLLRTPAFTTIALITFALGIGANTAIFSVVNAVLLRQLPYPNAARVVRLFETTVDQPGYGSVNYLNLMDWKKQATHSFERIGVYYVSMINMDGDGEPARLREGLLSADVLPILGVKPLLGRGFRPEDEVRGNNRVLLLSESLWRGRFASDPSIVGKRIMLESTPFTVIGVMPAGFNFPAGPRQVDLYSPFVPPPQALDPQARGWHWLSSVALLRPGVSIEQAGAEMKGVAAQIATANPQSMAKRSATAVTLHDAFVGSVRNLLFVLLGAVFLVLLIACANVANLLLARNAARRKDVAVRLALGAGRGQLARQLLTESIVLALLGALLGLGLSRLLLRVLIVLGPETLPVGTQIPLDARVMLVLIAGAALCGLAFGVAPALSLSRENLRNGLAGLTVKTTSGGEMRRFRSALVVAQVALSLMLLIGAGLLMRGFVAIQNTDPGVVSARLLTARLSVPRRIEAQGNAVSVLLRPMLERVRAIPGVKSAAVINMLPIDAVGSSANFWIDRRAWPAAGNTPMAEVRYTSPGFFSTMGMQVKAGRDFTESDDTTGTPKVIINEAMAQLLVPGANPIGRFLLEGGPTNHIGFEIIGVVSNVRQAGLDAPPRPEIYTPYADTRADWAGGDVSLVVRTIVPELSIVPETRAAVREVARDVAITNVRSMDEVIDDSLSGRKLTLVLFAIFAVVALVLAASGLYGVIHYLVTQRTREIGIRVALGARTSRVVAMVLGQGLALVSVGILLGLCGAFALSRLLGGMLYGVGARDPLTFVAVPVVLGTVALLATIAPAWKAARVDPVIALREE